MVGPLLIASPPNPIVFERVTLDQPVLRWERSTKIPSLSEAGMRPRRQVLTRRFTIQTTMTMTMGMVIWLVVGGSVEEPVSAVEQLRPPAFRAAQPQPPETDPLSTAGGFVMPDDAAARAVEVSDRDGFKPNPKWKPLGQALWFDPAEKRLILRAEVCLREGALEHLLCLRRTKEHESILTTPATPKLIQAGLLLTGAEPGGVVRYEPKFRPPHGTAMAIDLEWKDDQGRLQRQPAQTWVRSLKGDLLHEDWVFAGSSTYTDRETGKTYFGGDEGDLITVVNFPTAILDLPIASSASDQDRVFEANTPAIPPKGTPVTLYLRPKTVATTSSPSNPKPAADPANPTPNDKDQRD